MRSWSNIGLAWKLIGSWSWFILGLTSIVVESSSWHGVWNFEMGLIFGHEGYGLWIGLSKIRFLEDGGHKDIGSSLLGSWNGHGSITRLGGYFSIDSPWEVSS